MSQTIVDRNKVVDVARSWLRTPYHHNARIKGVGVDCGTFLAGVYEEAGMVERIPIEPYSHDWHLHRSEEKYLGYVQRFAREITIEELGVGDVIAWRYGRCFSHGAIYVGGGQVIHAVINVGCTMDDLHSEQFKSRPRRIFTFWDEA